MIHISIIFNLEINSLKLHQKNVVENFNPIIIRKIKNIFSKESRVSLEFLYLFIPILHRGPKFVYFRGLNWF